jgi:tRNA G18 (ribose-2'-O)-methylase SpoU
MPTIVAIDDPADARIDAYRDIRERDLVGRDGMFVAEGKVVLEKLVASGAYRPLSLLIAAKRLDALEPILTQLPDDVPVFAATQPVIDAVAGFPLHRGILAIGRRMENPTADALLAGIAGDADVLVLSAIANHDNMGGIFRNAAAFGVKAVLLDSDCCDPLYRKAIRVSVGAALLVPFARLERGEDPLALLDRHGFPAIALSPARKAPVCRPISCSALPACGSPCPRASIHSMSRRRAVSSPIIFQRGAAGRSTARDQCDLGLSSIEEAHARSVEISILFGAERDLLSAPFGHGARGVQLDRPGRVRMHREAAALIAVLIVPEADHRPRCMAVIAQRVRIDGRLQPRRDRFGARGRQQIVAVCPGTER